MLSVVILYTLVTYLYNTILYGGTGVIRGSRYTTRLLRLRHVTINFQLLFYIKVRRRSQSSRRTRRTWLHKKLPHPGELCGGGNEF